MNLNEKLSIPDGIIDNAINIYNNILNDKGDNFILNKQIINSELNRFDAFISLNKLNKNRDKQLYDLNEIEINFIFRINQDINIFIDKNRIKIISIIAHELKHLYDIKYMGGVNYTKLVEYEKYIDLYKNKINTNTIIDDFIYYLYLSTDFESLVQTSEMVIKIKELKISKRCFKEFLNTDSQFNELKNMQTINLNKIKHELNKDTNKIKSILNNNKIKWNNFNIIDTFLNYIKNIISNDDINTEQFFNNKLKLINTKAELNIKKIYKLIDFCIADAYKPLYEKQIFN